MAENQNLKPKSYEEKYEGNKELSTLLFNRLNDLKKEIKVMLPCRVESVNNDGNYVSLEILDYDSDNLGNEQEYPIITNVPIRQPMDSGSAYIRLPIQVGDIGTIEFFDSSVDDLVISNTHTFDFTEDWHKLSDGLFTNGFLPNNKLFEFDSNAKLVLGTKSNKIYIKFNNDDEIEILAEKINISTKEITLTSTTKIDIVTPIINVTGNINVLGTITSTVDVIGGGKSLKTHTHPYTDNGNVLNTSPPN